MIYVKKHREHHTEKSCGAVYQTEKNREAAWSGCIDLHTFNLRNKNLKKATEEMEYRLIIYICICKNDLLYLMAQTKSLVLLVRGTLFIYNAILVTHSEVSHLQVIFLHLTSILKSSIEVRCNKISSSICIKSNLSLTFPLHRWGKLESIINYLSRVIAIDNKNQTEKLVTN